MGTTNSLEEDEVHTQQATQEDGVQTKDPELARVYNNKKLVLKVILTKATAAPISREKM